MEVIEKDELLEFIEEIEDSEESVEKIKSWIESNGEDLDEVVVEQLQVMRPKRMEGR